MTEQGSLAELKKAVRLAAPYVVIAAVSFFIYQAYVLQNSFSALYEIALTATSRWQSTGSLWPLFWLTAESSGEVGLILRFVGACFFLLTAWFLMRKKQFSLPHLSKAVLLEAVYFLFYIPFTIYYTTRPGASLGVREAGVSYALQTAFVSPAFVMFYLKLKRCSSQNEGNSVVRWFAISFCLYAFALWVKHFLFAVYAVGIDFSEAALAVGSVNSIVTLLVAAVASVGIFLPVIRGKQAGFSVSAFGVVLICVGMYFVIFILLSLVNANYLKWVNLTEWWATALLVLGLGLVFRKKPHGT
jgi:hypothetical protein